MYNKPLRGKETDMAFEVVDKKMQFAVIGLGIFGRNVALSLVEEGVEVVAIDRDKELVELIKDKGVFPYVLDSTKEESLIEAGVDTVDCVIVCIGVDMVASILTTLILKKFKIARIVARAYTEEHAQILKLIGVNEVIQLEMDVSKKLARRLVGQGGLVLSYEEIWKDHAIIEIKVDSNLAGKTLKELEFRKRFHVNIVAIKKIIEKIDTEDYSNLLDFEINEVPDPDVPLKEGESLITIGRLDNIRRLNSGLIGKE
jgi:trk system potassium uptake protein TrkA